MSRSGTSGGVALAGVCVETGFSGEYSELLGDKDMWLVGGDGRVCTVLLINIDESCAPPPPGRLAPTRVIPIPGNIGQNAVESDSESETGFLTLHFRQPRTSRGFSTGSYLLGSWRYGGLSRNGGVRMTHTQRLSALVVRYSVSRGESPISPLTSRSFFQHI
jgi:hypothetical protein